MAPAYAPRADCFTRRYRTGPAEAEVEHHPAHVALHGRNCARISALAIISTIIPQARAKGPEESTFLDGE